MKKLLLLSLLALPLLSLGGCETLVDSSAENGNRVARTVDTNGKQIPDDTERLLLLDRPSWLTDKPIFMY